VLRELTTNQKGMVAETAIVHKAVKLGVGVARPLDDERYDLILDFEGRLIRVQCKWAGRSENVVVVRCCSTRRAAEGLRHRVYTGDEIDAIAAYCEELDACYLIPGQMVSGKTQLHLRLERSRNNQWSGVNWASDFEFGARLGRLFPGP
jgi:PD-(D/E)XK nuclease superfamily protein